MNKVPQNLNILCVDDDETVLKIYESFLPREGHKIRLVRTGKEAVEEVFNQDYDLILLDLKLPDMDGVDVLKQIQDKTTFTPVIIVTANPSVDSSIEAIRYGGVTEYVIKPVESIHLSLAVRRAIEKSQLKIENMRLVNKLKAANQALQERVEQLEETAREAEAHKARIKELEEKIGKK